MGLTETQAQAERESLVERFIKKPAYTGFESEASGVNHLAFPAPTREAVDELHGWLGERRMTVLYGGPMDMGTDEAPNYAVYFEDPDRLKLEYVYRPHGLGAPGARR